MNVSYRKLKFESELDEIPFRINNEYAVNIPVAAMPEDGNLLNIAKNFIAEFFNSGNAKDLDTSGNFVCYMFISGDKSKYGILVVPEKAVQTNKEPLN